MTNPTWLSGTHPSAADPSSLAGPPVHGRDPSTLPASRAVVELVSEVAALDLTLLPEFAATAVVVDAHATALEVTLRRYNTLETRLCGVVSRLEQRGCRPSEEEFAALLDYIGSSDVRLRVGNLQEAFPP